MSSMNKATPGWSMGARRDWLTDDGSTPGPGSYLALDTNPARKSFSQNTGFGTSDRYASSNSMPGPGAYDHGAGIGKGAGFSFTPRRKPLSDKEGEGKPGPGTYGDHSKMPTEGPKFTVMPRRSGLKKEITPGPDVYDPPPGLKIAKKTRSPGGFGFSSRADPTPRGSTLTPGPGTYGKEVSKPSYAVEKPPPLKSAKPPMLEIAASYEAAPVEMIQTESPQRQIKSTSVQKPSPKGQASDSAFEVKPMFPKGDEEDMKHIPLASPKVNKNQVAPSSKEHDKKPSPKADDKTPVPTPKAVQQKPPLAKADDKTPDPSPKAGKQKPPLASPEATALDATASIMSTALDATAPIESADAGQAKSNRAKKPQAQEAEKPQAPKTEGMKKSSSGTGLAGGSRSEHGGGASTCTSELSKHLDDSAHLSSEIEEDFDDDFEEESDDKA